MGVKEVLEGYSYNPKRYPTLSSIPPDTELSRKVLIRILGSSFVCNAYKSFSDRGKAHEISGENGYNIAMLCDYIVGTKVRNKKERLRKLDNYFKKTSAGPSKKPSAGGANGLKVGFRIPDTVIEGFEVDPKYAPELLKMVEEVLNHINVDPAAYRDRIMQIREEINEMEPHKKLAAEPIFSGSVRWLKILESNVREEEKEFLRKLKKAYNKDQ